MDRVIFTGSREFPTTAAHHVMDVLLTYCEGYDTVVHGDARGLDSIVDVLARGFGYAVEPHPANWRPNGKLDLAAGTKRNVEMAKLGGRICLAFLVEGMPCKGTRNMIQMARAYSIPVVTFILTREGELHRVEDLCDL